MTPKRLDSAKPIRRIPIFVLLACAFAFKLLVVYQLKDHPLTQPDAGLDTTAYANLANRVLGGDIALGPGLYFVSPLYIYFLAACLAIFKSYTAVRLVQIALGTASIGFIFLTTRLWFGERAAWAAAALAASTGLFTFYEALILQSSIDAFLTSAALYALARGFLDLPPNGGSYRKSPTDRVASAFRRKDIFLAGLIFGIQTLNRPNVLLAAFGVALAAIVVLRRVRVAALLVAGLAIGMSPALIRNVVIAHQWTFVSSHGGLNFYIGNGEGATGFYHVIPGISPTIGGQENDVRRVAERALGHPVSDAEASDYFFGLGRSWIEEHPATALALFLKKFAFVFSAQHIPLPHSYPFYLYDEKTALRFSAIGPWLLIPIGLVGVTFAARPARWREFIVWVAFIPAYAAAVAVFFVAERYRLPLLVPLAIGAGAAVDFIVRGFASRRLTPLAVPAVVLTLLLVAVNWPHRLNNGRWLEGMRLAERLVIQQRYDEADAWATRLDATGPPHPGAGHYGVGAQLLAVNQPNRALPDLEEAHRADPGDAAVEYALGQALLKTGHATAAVPHLRRGFEAGIELPSGGYDLAAALQAAGDLPGAAAVIRRINPSESWDAESWLRLGRLAMEVRAPDVAERFFRHAVEMTPGDAGAHQQYGLNLLLLARFGEAARELGEAVRLNPRDPDSLSHLAYCEAKLGRTADARAHAAEALAVNPNDQLARQLTGILR